MTITESKRAVCRSKIVESWNPSLRVVSREERAARADFVINRVTSIAGDNLQITRRSLRSSVMAAFVTKYESDAVGSALLTFLMFQAIWWFVKQWLFD